MIKPALALLVVASLLCALPIADSAFSLTPPQSKQVVVGKSGLKLYPRFNKSLKPITELNEGQTITILREMKGWKYIQLSDSDKKGWVFIKKTETASLQSGKKFDTVAAPSITGLVAKGWSKDYASRHGADYNKVDKIKKRTLNPDRYSKFLEGEDK